MSANAAELDPTGSDIHDRSCLSVQLDEAAIGMTVDEPLGNDAAARRRRSERFGIVVKKFCREFPQLARRHLVEGSQQR